jgi:hypothetical protein
MSSGAEHLLLYGIFLKLREAGMPLQIRDYLEGLQALSLYGGLDPFATLSGVRPETSAAAGLERLSRQSTYRVRVGAELVWLCQVLWARSQDERDIIERVITSEIELPPPKRISELHDLLKALVSDQPPESQTEPAPVVPFEAAEARRKEEGEPDSGSEEGEGERGEQTAETRQSATEDEEAKEADTIPVTIVDREDGDMSMPLLGHSEIGNDLTFLPIEPPIISPLWLVALWRRFFIPVRRRDTMEIDAAATVRAAARSGSIVAPVMKLRRKNTARLLLLIDTGEAMTPWRQFENLLVESLDPRTSRLHAVEIRYFNGVPSQKAFVERNLRKAEPLAEVLKRNGGNPLLVVGEGGVVQARSDPSFRRRMEELLSLADAFENNPLIWVNPMPRRRWPGSLMDLLNDRPNVHAVELNPEALLRAVDLMRGIAN